MFTEDALLPLFGLQHLSFCERQWALIHIERQWGENRLMAEGRLPHAHVDGGPNETRKGIRIVRGLALQSLELGLSGTADVVEFPLDGSSPTPFEYKRGRPKVQNWDKIQLRAQALCLEEMGSPQVPAGALFYWQTRRRLEVAIDGALRGETTRLAQRMHYLHAQRSSPTPEFRSRCRQCSLLDVCQPQALEQRGSARTFLRRSLKSSLLAPEDQAE